MEERASGEGTALQQPRSPTRAFLGSPPKPLVDGALSAWAGHRGWRPGRACQGCPRREGVGNRGAPRAPPSCADAPSCGEPGRARPGKRARQPGSPGQHGGRTVAARERQEALACRGRAPGPPARWSAGARPGTEKGRSSRCLRGRPPPPPGRAVASQGGSPSACSPGPSVWSLRPFRGRQGSGAGRGRQTLPGTEVGAAAEGEAGGPGGGVRPSGPGASGTRLPGRARTRARAPRSAGVRRGAPGSAGVGRARARRKLLRGRAPAARPAATSFRLRCASRGTTGSRGWGGRRGRDFRLRAAAGARRPVSRRGLGGPGRAGGGAGGRGGGTCCRGHGSGPAGSPGADQEGAAGTGLPGRGSGPSPAAVGATRQGRDRRPPPHAALSGAEPWGQAAGRAGRGDEVRGAARRGGGRGGGRSVPAQRRERPPGTCLRSSAGASYRPAAPPSAPCFPIRGGAAGRRVSLVPATAPAWPGLPPLDGVDAGKEAASKPGRRLGRTVGLSRCAPGI